MRPSSTINCPPQTAPADSLHPVLKEALGCLDVQLEEELTRYRRQRALGKSGYSPRKSAYKAAAKTLQPNAIAAAPRLSTPRPSSATPEAERLVEGVASETGVADNLSTSKSYLELKELAQNYAARIDQEADLAAHSLGGSEDYLESSEELLRSLATEEANVQAEQGFLRSLTTPFGIGAMLLLLLSSAMFGFVLMNPSSLTQWFGKKESQVATKSVNPANPSTVEGAAPTIPQPNLANQEFPDLNLSTLGSLTVEGAPVAKSGTPSTPGTKSKTQKANLGVSGVGTGSTPAPARPATAASEPGASPSLAEPAPPAGDIPSPRRLAPAPDYNSAPARTYTTPSTPVRPYTPPASRPYVKPSQSPAAKKSTSPSKPRTPVNKPAATSPVPSLPPLKLTPEPSPTTSVSPAVPLNEVSPSPSPSTSNSPGAMVPNGYKVVVPYTSDRALEQAREKVPEAYLQNYSDGAKVQMGAYDTETTAKKRAEELRQQGIPAEVYKP
jgi:hypothetical protein